MNTARDSLDRNGLHIVLIHTIERIYIEKTSSVHFLKSSPKELQQWFIEDDYFTFSKKNKTNNP